MIDEAVIAEATRRAATTGYSRVAGAIPPRSVEQLLAESTTLTFSRLEPVIGGVRQNGDLARVRPFAVLDVVTDHVVDEWLTEPGDACVLAGGGLGDRDRRPRHSVGAPVDARRLSLTLRMKQRGA